MPELDLSSAEVIDSHCHLWLPEEVASRDLAKAATRLTLNGTCHFYETPEVQRRWDWGFVEDLDETTMLALVYRRWMGEHLGCEATKEAVTAARTAAISKDPRAYVEGLLRDQHIVGAIVDNGFPATFSHDELAASISLPIYRSHRVELWFDAHRDKGFDHLVSAVVSEAQEAARHPRFASFKSFAQVTTGLDVGDPSAAEAAASYRTWRQNDWKVLPGTCKDLFDYLLRRIMEVARSTGKAVHFHVGGEAEDPVYARPFDMYPLIRDFSDVPIVMIHCGFPWILETTYLATTFPHVYLDLSELIPWGWSQVEWVLKMTLGTVPAAKILYATDSSCEPEHVWLGAKLARQELTSVLSGFVERGYLTVAQAQAMGEGVLAENTRRLHGVG